MIYRIGVLGATGRMGSEVVTLLTHGFHHAGHSLVLVDAVAHQPEEKCYIGEVLVRSLSDRFSEKVDCWVDFSRPEATLELLRVIDGPVVIGTTGFTEQDLEKIAHFAKGCPVLLASNMSPGMVLMEKWLRGTPASTQSSYDVLLQEEHHRGKKDSPSGTAKSLVRLLAEQGIKDVSVETVRAGGILGVHSVRFVSGDEELCISHRVFNRSVFAKGCLFGALFLIKKRALGLYTMEGVFDASE